MPITYAVDPVCRQIRTVVSGKISVRNILEHFEIIQREDILSLPEFIDARQATKPYLTPEDMWSAANSVRAAQAKEPFGSRAVVVEDLVMYGLGRIFTQVLSGYFPIAMFRDMDTAEKWLAAQPTY
jgi:hypothetical protein